MKRIDSYFERMLGEGASDLHIMAGNPPYIRRYGELIALNERPLSPEDVEAMLFEITDAEQTRTVKTRLDLDFSYQMGNTARFRANYFYKVSGLAGVFRVIPAKIMTLDELQTPLAIRKLAEARQGLVLVTGPTGSGKSTTLAAMVHHINQSRPGHILTIEDPVEFVHQNLRCRVTHREVGTDVPDFATAIRSAGREDPDVILVGELRGMETMKLAIDTAAYGILVFATVHTNSAAETVERIVNTFPADQQPQVRGLLADSLTGIVSQQLVLRTGGRGRVAAHEILLRSTAIANVIREGKSYQLPSLMQTGTQAGMQTIDMSLARLVREGKVSLDNALIRASDREMLTKLVRSGDAALGMN